MAKPLNPLPQYLPLKDVLELFNDNDKLLVLLREGSLVARGRIEQFDVGPFSNATKPVEISLVTWRDYEFVDDLRILRSDDFQEFIFQIEIERAKIEALTKISPSLNKGGRPARHDWDKFWIEVCHEIYNGAELTSIAQFAGDCLEFEMWNGDPPDQRTIEKRLKPLFDKLSA